ncbi:MAG: uracil-DNA glycosylase family protein [Thiobacillus sp.]|nr:uracil-DNA glycosylase family protein [Thiobacillus sp.]
MSHPGHNSKTRSLSELVAQAQACTVCAEHLSHGPRPIFSISPTARLLLIGQAPGRRVHETGIPWNDPSGDTLRAWLGMTREQFYDVSHVAILPTGLCYPGTVKGSDLPPRPECAPLWHQPMRDAMPNIQLTLLIGAYAQAYYLGKRRGRTLTDTVQAWRDVAPDYFPLPHPSPRNRPWLKRNPWFEQNVLPDLKNRVGAALATSDNGTST